MNLQQVTEALQQNNIQIALDLGVHEHCSIDSNCPKAVELRRIINESGITLSQLLEGFVAPSAEPIPFTLPEFDSKVTLRIAGQNVELDLGDSIRKQLGDALGKKTREFEQMGGAISAVGRGLFTAYLNKIDTISRNRTLPQLNFSLKDLTRTNCLITTEAENYIFLFARRYNPEYIINRKIRYKLADGDIENLKRDIYVSYIISKERKIISVKILDNAGRKFLHYHGNEREDCWGQVKLPERWGGDLDSLYDLTFQLMGALHTINKDSLISEDPIDMPHIDELMSKSTKLGEEGVSGEREQPEGRWDARTPRGWGQGRRTTGNPTEETPDVVINTEENPVIEDMTPMMLRFNIDQAPADTDFDTRCNLCGIRLGNHFGIFPNITCPRDR